MEAMNLITYKDGKNKKDVLAVRLDVLYDHINCLEVESNSVYEALRMLKYNVMIELGKLKQPEVKDDKATAE